MATKVISKPGAFVRETDFLPRVIWGVGVGMLAAVGAFAFVAAMTIGMKRVWPVHPGPELFSGSWRIVAIMTVAGFLVGVVHHFMEARMMDVFSAAAEGQFDTKPVVGSLIVGLISLVGGFSVGPEVPVGILACGLGAWISKKYQLSERMTRTNILTGLMGAYGGLFTTPFAVIVMPLEIAHVQRGGYYGTLSIAAMAALAGFALFFTAAGRKFATILRFLDLPAYDLKIWHLGAAIGVAVVGAAVALAFGATAKVLKRVAAPLDKKPIVRGTLGGVLLGLLAMAVPLTLFLGTEGLQIVVKQAGQFGIAILVVIMLAKILALAGALAMGFIGGPIFPLLFIGGTLGLIIHGLVPAIPLALTVGCAMAAVPAALLPVPLSLTVIVLMMVGTPITEVIPVNIAGLLAYAITHGLGLVGEGEG